MSDDEEAWRAYQAENIDYEIPTPAFRKTINPELHSELRQIQANIEGLLERDTQKITVVRREYGNGSIVPAELEQAKVLGVLPLSDKVIVWYQINKGALGRVK